MHYLTGRTPCISDNDTQTSYPTKQLALGLQAGMAKRLVAGPVGPPARVGPWRAMKDNST